MHQRGKGSNTTKRVCGSGFTCYKQQFVEHVYMASDQYGPLPSVSYTAIHMEGPPTIETQYDEVVDSYMLTTYANWWRMLPSYNPEFGLENVGATEMKKTGHDFIVLSFEKAVIPLDLEIFESFNPGCIMSIWAYMLDTLRWVQLWHKELGRKTDVQVRMRLRSFFPNLLRTSSPTRMIRLVFDTSGAPYLPGFDGVLMGGILAPCEREKMAKKLMAMNLESPPEAAAERVDAGTASILNLPDEVLLNIFSKLDFRTLITAGAVCQKFYRIAHDPHLFLEVNLRPYWMHVGKNTIHWLQRYATLIQKLDLSWCGIVDSYFAQSIVKFLQVRGKTITHLRLDDLISVFSPESINSIAEYCPALKEVSFKQMQFYESPRQLKFNNLTRLNLARTSINTESMTELLTQNPQLQHLNLLCCYAIDIQLIAIAIAKFNHELISLNLWKAGTLQDTGLRALQACTKLRELDVGWTMSHVDVTGALGDVLKSCPHMYKLGLAGMRNLQDSDLADIARFCRNLTQLDLLGCLRVTAPPIELILKKCVSLRYIDLFHCCGFDEAVVSEWERTYDRVTITYRSKIMSMQGRNI